MGLTQAQAADHYLLDSMAYFLDRNVKSPYDSAVSVYSGAVTPPYDISKPIRIRMGKPDDRDVIVNPPVIAMEPELISQSIPFFEIGSSKAWRFYDFRFYCYPCITTDGEPSLEAQLILKSAMRNAFGTECIRIVDYGNVLCSPTNIVLAPDDMYIVTRTGPSNRGSSASLAIERHRFDMDLRVKVCVVETLNT